MRSQPQAKSTSSNSSTEPTELLRRRYQQKTPAAPIAATDQIPAASLNFSRVPLYASSDSVVQAKLTVGSPNDKYEQEADRVAEQVMRMPAPSETAGAVRSQPPKIQRKCAKCDDEQRLQMKETPSGTPEVTPAVASRIQFLQGSGQPLSDSTRSFFEPRFGQDFSHVRVHNDAQTTEALNARAYTVSNNIVFGSGQYSPETSAGRQLLAHELAHTIQQGSSTQSTQVQRQVAAPPAYRDCSEAITGVPDANTRLENARQRAREFVGAALRALDNPPVVGTTYETALNRHFVTAGTGLLGAGSRALIHTQLEQIRATLRVPNYICNSNNICGTEQAFWIAADDLVHVCRPFWALDTTCAAIVLIHEGAHDVGIGIGAAHPPNRGSAAYPAGNVAPPAGQTTLDRLNNPDAYAFFAAHIWRNTDTSRTCF